MNVSCRFHLGGYWTLSQDRERYTTLLGDPDKRAELAQALTSTCTLVADGLPHSHRQ
jgi:lipocalin